ncbi:MAG: phosphate uptake regulator, PhoU [Acidimicrobiaceae bacterium]|jgi:phosphate transport system protein|nr:phosphate uptake regulator, PhoU [Acidimicrobiaceae bacterium]
MSSSRPPAGFIDQQVIRLFTLVSEALAGATHALLNGEAATGQRIVDADETIDHLTAELDRIVWAEISRVGTNGDELRHLVGVLLILPELERSADLAEHIAQRAVSNLGAQMSPMSRGIVQRMSEVALEMWRAAAEAYVERSSQGVALDDADEEMDILHDRLTREITAEAMPTPVAAQVTLLARFYERLGDHAVNLARRIGSLPGLPD